MIVAILLGDCTWYQQTLPQDLLELQQAGSSGLSAFILEHKIDQQSHELQCLVWDVNFLEKKKPGQNMLYLQKVVLFYP